MTKFDQIQRQLSTKIRSRMLSFKTIETLQFSTSRPKGIVIYLFNIVRTYQRPIFDILSLNSSIHQNIGSSLAKLCKSGNSCPHHAFLDIGVSLFVLSVWWSAQFTCIYHSCNLHSRMINPEMRFANFEIPVHGRQLQIGDVFMAYTAIGYIS